MNAVFPEFLVLLLRLFVWISGLLGLGARGLCLHFDDVVALDGFLYFLIAGLLDFTIDAHCLGL